ncbi:acyl-CoA N-acyltransferase [Xylariomycetidae sp. FL0641]|nr:acyl-CoA N-acyltransferase [Xylariomycetidae sp. FL0641]
MTDIFRSERLMYVPIEKGATTDSFFHALMREPSNLNVNSHLPNGATRAASVEALDALPQKRLLSVYICLPPPPPEPVGIVSLSRPAPGLEHHGAVQLALMVAARHQRQGYGAEAVRWALWWGFAVARLHRVEIGCYSWNPGALRLYQRLGFVLEGTKREAVWFMGAWRHVHELAMLEHEWRARRLEEEVGKGEERRSGALSDAEVAEMMKSA